jgi:signal transduction histidine kinase
MQAVDGALNVQVQDDGYGIPSADLPFIFDRFYRVRREGNEVEGNGLGLAIVKSIVEQHNGQVSVESEPQQGSCFSVRLPLPSTKTEVDGSASVTDKSCGNFVLSPFCWLFRLLWWLAQVRLLQHQNR